MKDLKIIQEEELKMLKEFADFCKENNLTYSLAYGSLLGAIRHKGFIPWDDDIDVMMPEEDYLLFINDYKGDCEIFNFQKKNYFNVAFTKIKKEVVVNGKKFDAFIDIFPFIKTTIDTKKCKKRIKFYKTILLLKQKEQIGTMQKVFKKLLARIFNFLLIPIKKSYVVAKLYSCVIERKEGKKLRYYYGFAKPVFEDVDFFDEMLEVPFDGINIKIVAKYDQHLKKEYGDYMKLPVGKDRKPTHLINEC